MFNVERWMLNVQLFKLLGYFFGSAEYLQLGSKGLCLKVETPTGEKHHA
jgi:hypothetical protein